MERATLVGIRPLSQHRYMYKLGNLKSDYISYKKGIMDSFKRRSNVKEAAQFVSNKSHIDNYYKQLGTKSISHLDFSTRKWYNQNNISKFLQNKNNWPLKRKKKKSNNKKGGG